MSTPLLEVRDFVKHFPVSAGWFRPPEAVRAVDGVSFTLPRGKTLGLVGESGCGKSTLARLVLRLIEPTSGRAWLSVDGAPRELTALDPEALRRTRRHMQIVFQDPYASLDPRMTVGSIVGEPTAIFGELDRAARRARTDELLLKVGLEPRFASRYPHQFSGGQRQRIGIARALALAPSLVVLDEPVSALDVSIQAQILGLLQELKAELGLTYLFIAHDLAVVRHISDEVAVMYLGRIVERASADELYARPLHPYTQALMSAAPIPDPAVERTRKKIILEGSPPSPRQRFMGCPFASRCPIAEPACSTEPVALVAVAPGHDVACRLVSGRAN